MKNKKGFTLTELLAVIALIGIIMMLITPNILKLFNSSTKQLFYDEILTLYNNAYSTYIYRSSEGDYNKNFCVGKETKSNPMDIEEQEDFYYDVTVDAKGNVISLKASNERYGFTLVNSSGIKKNTIKISDITNPIDITCNGSSQLPEESLTCIITNSKRECNIFNFSYKREEEKA